MKVAAGPATLILEPWVGAGHDGFVRTGHGINTSTGTPEEIFSWGGFAAVSAKPASDMSVALGYGIDNPDDDDLEGLELDNARFLKNQRAFVNTWYSLNKTVKVGAELNYLKTNRVEDALAALENAQLLGHDAKDLIETIQGQQMEEAS